MEDGHIPNEPSISHDPVKATPTPAETSQVRVKVKKTALSFSAPQTFVTFVVGPEKSQVTHTVHKSVACHYSPFFEAAFNGDFTEGQSQRMQLDDVGKIIFGKIVHWMYEQKIENEDGMKLRDLGVLWTIAGRFLMPALQNTAMRAIYKRLNNLSREVAEPLRQFLDYVYLSKTETPLKQVVAYFFMSAWYSTNIMKRWADYLPRELLVTTAIGFADLHAELPKKYAMKEVKVEKFLLGEA